jgi:DNA polymerase III delta prime subunit
MISTANEMLWSQKYRPQHISETILPEKTKKTFQKFVDDKNIPNLLLSGGPGTGKTTAAVAMLKELECDYILINGSLNGGIDTLRHEIANFASSVSFTGGRKYVIIDEADYLTPNTQAGMRSFSEEFSKNCGFIFTCNFKDRIIAPLQSRFSLVDFSINKTEKAKIAMQFFKRVLKILDEQSIEYEQKVVAKVIEKHFPDFRRILNELQNYSASGKIDEGIFVNFKQESINQLFDFLKDKNFTEMRKWVAANTDQNIADLYRRVFDTGIEKVPDTGIEKVPMSEIPEFVILLGKYQYQNGLVPDQELNLVACFTEIMATCDLS